MTTLCALVIALEGCIEDVPETSAIFSQNTTSLMVQTQASVVKLEYSLHISRFLWFYTR